MTKKKMFQGFYTEGYRGVSLGTFIGEALSGVTLDPVQVVEVYATDVEKTDVEKNPAIKHLEQEIERIQSEINKLMVIKDDYEKAIKLIGTKIK